MLFVYIVAILWFLNSLKAMFFPTDKDAAKTMRELNTVRDSLSADTIMHWFGLLSFLALLLEFLGLYYTYVYCYAGSSDTSLMCFTVFAVIYAIYLGRLIWESFDIIQFIRLYGIRNNYKLYEYLDREKTYPEEILINSGRCIGFLFSLLLILILFFG